MHYSLMGKMRLPFIRDVIFPHIPGLTTLKIDPNFNVSFPATACSPTFHKNKK